MKDIELLFLIFWLNISFFTSFQVFQWYFQPIDSPKQNSLDFEKIFLTSIFAVGFVVSCVRVFGGVVIAYKIKTDWWK